MAWAPPFGPKLGLPFMVALVALLALSTMQQAASQPALCDFILPNVCRAVSVPVGVDLKKLKLKTAKKSLCNSAMQSALDSARGMCSCSAKLQKWAAKSPDLFRQGVAEAADPITGVVSPVLTGLASQTSCLIKAGLQATSPNKNTLLRQLRAKKPPRPLGGVQTYRLIYLPTIDLTAYIDLTTRVGICAGVAAPIIIDPALIVVTPLACQPLVDWFGQYADITLRTALAVGDQVVQPLVDYVDGLIQRLQLVIGGLEVLSDPDLWSNYLKAAAVMTKDNCPDPNVCFGGLVKDIWREMNNIPAAVEGTNNALQTALDLLAAARRVLAEGRALLQETERKLSDASFRSFSLYKALWMSLGAAFTGTQPDFKKLISHPAILSDATARFSSLSAMNDFVRYRAELDARVAAVTSQAGTAASNLKSRNAAVGDKLVQKIRDLTTIPAPVCNSSGTVACLIDTCTINPPNPPCPAGSRCITDVCAKCAAVCQLIPLNETDIFEAANVLDLWAMVLRLHPPFTNAVYDIADNLPLMRDSMVYLAGEVLGVDVSTLYDYGVLTYNVRARRVLDAPCTTGQEPKCFKILGKKVCMDIPTLSWCRVQIVVKLPNEHIPWAALHKGIFTGLAKAKQLLNPQRCIHIINRCSSKTIYVEVGLPNQVGPANTLRWWSQGHYKLDPQSERQLCWNGITQFYINIFQDGVVPPIGSDETTPKTDWCINDEQAYSIYELDSPQPGTARFFDERTGKTSDTCSGLGDKYKIIPFNRFAFDGKPTYELPLSCPFASTAQVTAAAAGGPNGGEVADVVFSGHPLDDNATPPIMAAASQMTVDAVGGSTSQMRLLPASGGLPLFDTQIVGRGGAQQPREGAQPPAPGAAADSKGVSADATLPGQHDASSAVITLADLSYQGARRG